MPNSYRHNKVWHVEMGEVIAHKISTRWLAVISCQSRSVLEATSHESVKVQCSCAPKCVSDQMSATSFDLLHNTLVAAISPLFVQMNFGRQNGCPSTNSVWKSGSLLFSLLHIMSSLVCSAEYSDVQCFLIHMLWNTTATDSLTTIHKYKCVCHLCCDLHCFQHYRLLPIST